MQLHRRSGGGAVAAAQRGGQQQALSTARPCVRRRTASHCQGAPAAAFVAAAPGLRPCPCGPAAADGGVALLAAGAAHRPRRSVSRRASAAADGGGGAGDVVRPSAKAAAPPVPLHDVDTSSSSTGASSSGGPSTSPGSPQGGGGVGAGAAAAAGSSGGGSSSSAVGRSTSYSDFYKLVNSAGAAGVQQQQQQQHRWPAERHAPDHADAGAGGAGVSSSSSLQNGADASTQTPAAAGVGAAAAGSSLALPQQPPPLDAAGVEDALKKAQQALAAAESSLGSIHKLRSARPPGQWVGLLQVLRSTATAVSVGAFLVASHAFGLGWQWAGATIGALALAALAYKQQTITEAGAVAAASACLATLGCSLRFGLVLLMVSYSSFKLRQFKEARAAPDVSGLLQQQQQQQSSARDWLEIGCIAAVPTILAVVYGAMAGCLDLPLGSLPNVEPWRADLLTLLQGAVLGWYACVCGDAWSSELGALSGDQPRLLTTLQPVRRGTHGGVTLLGLSGAAAGGLLVGLVFYCAAVLSPTLWVFEAQRAAAMAQWRVVPLGLMAGLFGSLLDSLLGAALQFTGYDTARSALTSTPGPSVQRISGLRQLRWLSDSVVDVAAAAVTAALTALAALATFG